MARRKFNILLIFVSLFILILTAAWSNKYYITQGVSILMYYLSAVPTEKILKDSSTSREIQTMLSSIRDIKDFTVRQLGLTSNNNYTSYVKVKKKHLMEMVTACKPDRFEEYNWDYPIMGKFPYKAFFYEKDALKEAEWLRKKGYETDIGGVSAFSTLGIFSDPIYSFFQNYSLYRLAYIIIHEQTHATVFIKNQLQFNESFATFVGQEGALLFIKEKYGDQSEDYRKAMEEINDSEAFVELIQKLIQELDKVYTSTNTQTMKLKFKKSIFEKSKKDLDINYNKYFQSKKYRFFHKIELNNAYLISYKTYNNDLSKFYEILNKNQGNLMKTIRGIKEKGRGLAVK